MFIYFCGHILETINDNCYLRDMYKSLVVHGLVPPPEARIHITHHCPKCLSIAFEEAWGSHGSVALKRKWGDMILHPLDTSVDLANSKDRISVLLMFHDLWTALNAERMHPYYFRAATEDVAHDLFFAYRYWCKTTALHWQAGDPERSARRRLLAVLQEQFGPLAAADVERLMDRYRLQPRDLEQILPSGKASSSRDQAYTACVQRLRELVRSRVPEYPVDFAGAYLNVLRAASEWSAELLGPPQQHDLHSDLLGYLIKQDPSYDMDQHYRLERVIMDLNDEAMRFKVQLFALFRYAEQTRRIESEDQLHRMVRLVDELEERAMLLRPLESRLRQLWALFVAFAKRHRHLISRQAA